MSSLRDEFVDRGVVRIPGAFSAEAAEAVAEILGRGAWQPPKVRAQILLTFPSVGPWILPRTWHVDGGFDRPVWPPPAIRMFSFFGPVGPEDGGTLLLEGSHHLVERYMTDHPTPIPGNSTTWGRFMRHHPELAELSEHRDATTPGRSLVGRAVDVAGVEVRPREATGEPGDLYLAHFYVFHSASPNVSDRPRQMLSTTASPFVPQ